MYEFNEHTVVPYSVENFNTYRENKNSSSGEKI